MRNDRYECPVCGFDGLKEAPIDACGCATFEICPCCGTEFGYDDATTSHVELRRSWIAQGMPWFSQTTRPPADWSPVKQLARLRL